MKLLDLLTMVEDMVNEFGEDVEVKSFLNHNLSPSIWYDESDDCVYVNN